MTKLSTIIALWNKVLMLQESIDKNTTEAEINAIYIQQDEIKDKIAELRFTLPLEDVLKEMKIRKIMFEK